MVGVGLFQMLFLFPLAEKLINFGVHNNLELKYRYVVIRFHIAVTIIMNDE